MCLRKLTSTRADESGIVLVEIVISAMLLVIVALGVFTAFDVGTRASSEERHRARAQALAEADVARMESMRIADLYTLNETKSVSSDGFNYTMNSKAEFVTEPASTSTCASGTGSRDYIKISSTVTWATIGSRPPVSVTSIVSPPGGSVVPNSGSLLVSVDDATGGPVSGVTLTGSGAGSFSGTTGPTGCVLWRNLPVGNYTMSIGGTASDMVDPNGDPASARPVSVVAESTNTVALEFDSPGRIANVTFRTKRYNSGALDPSGTESIVVSHSSLDQVITFVPPDGGRASSFTTTQTLYPFPDPSAYTVYAGTCTGNLPTAGGALASAVVPRDGTFDLLNPPPGNPIQVIQLPAFHVTVYAGTGTTGSRVPNAKVRMEDDGCGNLRRTYRTNAEGRLGDPGMPWSIYDVCVSGIASDGLERFDTFSNVPLTTLAAGYSQSVTLGDESRGSC